MTSGVGRVYTLSWLVFLVGLLHPKVLQAEVSEERVSALEARLSRLERNLELLLNKVSAAPPLDSQAAKEIKEAAKPLAGEFRELQEASVLAVEPPTTPAPQSSLATTSTSAPDAAAEIQNVPYAGYMETHLNHDGLNPTLFDFSLF